MKHLLAIAVLLVACNPCRKAQGIMDSAAIRAARLCPEMVHLQTDTLRTTLPGDSSAGNVDYYGEDVDSVVAACDELHAALIIEQERHRVSINAASRVVMRTKAQVDSLKAVLAARNAAMNRLRKELCAFPGILDSTDLRRLRIWYTPTGPKYDLVDYPRTVEQVHTVPTVTQGPVITVRSTPWWMYVWAVAATLLCGWFYLRSDHFQYHYEKLKR